MNLRYTTLAACSACSAAWMHTPVLTNSRHNVHNRFMDSGRVVSSMGGTRLMATVVPEDVEGVSALTPCGDPIGEGSVVACLPGGLIAVKVDDSIDLSARSPKVDDTLSKEKKKVTLSGTSSLNQSTYNYGKFSQIHVSSRK
jgi:hypothetical protein